MQGWGLLFLRFKKKFQSAHALAVHLHGAGSIYRKDETETVSHSLITKFETKKKKITNLRQWPGPLLQNF